MDFKERIKQQAEKFANKLENERISRGEADEYHQEWTKDRAVFRNGALWAVENPTSDYVWNVYNFVLDYKAGNFGPLAMQDAIDKYFKARLASN